MLTYAVSPTTLTARPTYTTSSLPCTMQTFPQSRWAARLEAPQPGPTSQPSSSGRCALGSWTRSVTSRSIVCMAHPRRVAKVASAIQRELSHLFIYDQVCVNAITPDRKAGGTDISAVASITDVYVSNDLQVVKVYVSIYSDGRGKQRAMENLRKLAPYVRSQMAQRVVLRLTPEYRFEYDDSLEEAELVARVIGDDEIARFTDELDADNAGRSAANNPGDASTRSLTGQPRLTRSLQLGQGRDSSLEHGHAQGASADAGDADGAGFFDDAGFPGEEEDDEEEVEEEGRGMRYTEVSSSDMFGQPGPFDDLFGPLTNDGSLVGAARPGRGRLGRRDGGGRGAASGGRQQRDSGPRQRR